MSLPTDLSAVSSAELTRLLRAIHHGAFQGTVTRARLIETAFGDLERDLDCLVGLDPKAAQVVIAAVLAERSHQKSAAALSYMGIPLPGTRSRDMIEQVLELIAGTGSQLEVIGLQVRDDPRLLRAISGAASARGVLTRLVFDAREGEQILPLIKQLADDALKGAARNAVYVCTQAALRARVVICDSTRVLVTSANLGDDEDGRTIDAGALLDDAGYAALLLEEAERAIGAGLWLPV